MDKFSYTCTNGREWSLERVTIKGRERYPDIIKVGALDKERIYIPERKYKKLEQVALDMLEKIRTLSALCIDGYDFQMKLEAIEDDTRPFIERLKELGVIDD